MDKVLFDTVSSRILMFDGLTSCTFKRNKFCTEFYIICTIIWNGYVYYCRGFARSEDQGMLDVAMTLHYNVKSDSASY